MLTQVLPLRLLGVKMLKFEEWKFLLSLSTLGQQLKSFLITNPLKDNQ
jgi:hypothetical protein